jgi:hypothetical protein
MPTVSTPAFKNAVINAITGYGVIAGANQIGYVNAYNGAQAGDPSSAPAGTLVFASYSAANNLVGKMGTASQGVSIQGTTAGPTTPASAVAVTGLTFARIFGQSGAAIIDTPISLSGGGGGVIVNTLNPSVGVGYIVSNFAVKMPMSASATLKLNAGLANAIANNIAGIHTTSPYLGINSSGACVIKYYDGTPPADADAAPTGNLLATMAIGATQIWGGASAGAAALVSNPSVTASGTGTITYCRLEKTHASLTTLVMQGSCGTSGADFNVNTLSVTAGVTNLILNEATLSL